MVVRTRFAPSPTGNLHVGSVRVALFCWLYAKKHHGEYILRIEDTDKARSTSASIDAILAGLSWLNLEADVGPIFQMDRVERYHEVAEQLLAQGLAYRCDCSRERLATLRETQLAHKQKPRYDGHCQSRQLPAQTKDSVIRFKNPTTGTVIMEDAVHGRVEIDNAELDDVILIRSDATPTYNFGVVVDDMDMGVTHVIRGDDHINNTPRQINIYHALGQQPPQYVHVPMILGDDGKRLSKRHGAVNIMDYREQGILPQALLNYLVRLGWSHGDQEIFSLDEMVSLFDLSALHKSAAMVNFDKLHWLNQHYLKTLPPESLVPELTWQLQQNGITEIAHVPLVELIKTQSERCKTLREMVEKSRFFFEPVTGYDDKAVKKHIKTATPDLLQSALQALTDLPEWNATTLHALLERVCEQHDVKLGKLAQPLRIAMSGAALSPPMDTTLAILGKDTVLARLKAALDYFQKALDSRG